MHCDACGHEWHGLPCAHEAVVRGGWTLRRETCHCAGSWAGSRSGQSEPSA